jgi:RecA-family ATPase
MAVAGSHPLRGLTVLGGQPGLGKSLLTVKLVADVTRGRLGLEPGVALVLSAEDARGQVVLPRLFAANAHLGRVRFDNVLDDAGRRQLFLPDDAPQVMEMVQAYGAKLIVIDPLNAHLPGKVNTWQDQSVRLALAPVAQLAEESGAAVLVVSHLNKGQGTDPLQRLGGSIGLAAAARSVLLLARDPDDPEGERGSRRVLAQVKSNYGAKADSLLYAIESERITRQQAGIELEAPRVVELGYSPYSGEELLVPRDAEPAGATAEAIAFLRAELAEGPRTVPQLREASDAAGLSSDTVKGAKSKAGVKSEKTKSVANGPWRWALEPAGAVAENARG